MNGMRKQATVYVLVAAAVAAISGGWAPPAAAQTVSIPVGPRPESITRGWQGKFFVTIQGPSGNLGVFDGEVRRVDLTTGTVTPFVTGLENPRGIAFTGRYLVVADQLKIFRIDQAGGKVLLAEAGQFPFPVAFFNDVAAEEGGRAVYVSEMGRRDLIRITPPPGGNPVLIPVDSPAAYAIPATSRVYRVQVEGPPRITSLFEPSRKLLVINGVAEVKRRRKLLVVDFFHGNVVEVDLQRGSKQILATALRAADGVEQARDGTIFVSSFDNGTIFRLSEEGEDQRILLDGVGFQTTADFYLDERAGQLYVPNTRDGTVMIVPTE